jgi:hypothetical protein
MARSKRRPASCPQTLASVLAATRDIAAPADVQAPPIGRADWEQAVGTRIARHAQPLRLGRGVLFVRVSSAAWANELGLLAEDIITQLRRHGVALSKLRFSVGPIDQPGPVPALPPLRAAAPDAPLPEELRAAVGRIEDADLRAALAGAAAKTLSRRASQPVASPSSSSSADPNSADRIISR